MGVHRLATRFKEKAMTRFKAMVAVCLVLAGGLALADDAKKETKKPVGVWKRTAGDATITFDIKADGAKVTIANGGNTIEVDCDYGLTKDSVLFGRINKVTKKGTDDGPSEGDLFSFKFGIADDVLTLSELKAPQDSAEVKQLIEGEYKKEKGG
jgi:hypothetical protein